jgi:hypothetical protein
LGAVLDPLTGVFHVLAKAVGRVAAQAGYGHERNENKYDKYAFQ